jgi:sulfite reductase alpha subunit-like flavoprotein
MVQKRSVGLYQLDGDASDRVAAANPEIKTLYAEYLGEPGSHLAHSLLHTRFETHETASLAQSKRTANQSTMAFSFMEPKHIGQGGSSSRFQLQGRLPQSFSAAKTPAFTSSGFFDSHLSSGRLTQRADALQGSLQTVKSLIDNFATEIPIPLNQFDTAALLKLKTAVFVMNLHQLPLEFAPFVEQLRHETDDLAAIQFAVCGLHNRTVPSSSHALMHLDELLVARGAKRMMPLTVVDIATADHGEGAFDAWALCFCTSIGIEPKFLVKNPFYTLADTIDDVIRSCPMKPRGYDWGRIKSIEPLTPPDSPLQISKYVIKLPAGMPYRVMDNIAILPKNPPAAVQTVARAMHINTEACFEITTAHPEAQAMPELATVQQILEQYLDLSGPPSRHIIRVFAQAADPLGAKRLNDMLAIANEEAFKAYIETRTLADFVAEFAVFGVPDFGLFVGSCPHIVPRFYTVVSQIGPAKRKAEIIVANNPFGPDNQRKGLCTSFLSVTQDAIAVRIARGSFKYPKRQSVGFVVIGIGNGIPMVISLLEYRASLTGRVGPMVLILEGTTPAEMTKLDARIQEYVAKKLVNSVTWAYANDPAAKYRGFGDALKGATSAVWDLWMDSDTYLFASGCRRFHIDIIRELLCKMTVNEAGLRDEEAMAVSNQHEFHFELNGMQMNVATATD